MRSGPIKSIGDARWLRCGSVMRLIPLCCQRKVEWPNQVRVVSVSLFLKNSFRGRICFRVAVAGELYPKTVSRVWRNPWSFTQKVNDYFGIQMGYDEQKH